MADYNRGPCPGSEDEDLICRILKSIRSIFSPDHSKEYASLQDTSSVNALCLSDATNLSDLAQKLAGVRDLMPKWQTAWDSFVHGTYRSNLMQTKRQAFPWLFERFYTHKSDWASGWHARSSILRIESKRDKDCSGLNAGEAFNSDWVGMSSVGMMLSGSNGHFYILLTVRFLCSTFQEAQHIYSCTVNTPHKHHWKLGDSQAC